MTAVAAAAPAQHDYVVSEADYLRRPAPHYPPLAQRQRQYGTVLLRVVVGTDGHPVQVRVERSSGYTLLDRAAEEAVRQALFRPFVLDGVPHTAEVVVPLEFLLRTA
jgi:protein TonB